LNYLYADILIQQKKYSDAISVIEKAIATFGIKDGILKPARFVRERIGLFSKEPGVNPKGISLCMIVKNEEKTLAKCLFSVKGLVDEIIVVDTGSSDHTKEIAYIFGASVYDFAWNDNFSDARNVSLSKANGAWILILDADERISQSDRAAIRKMTAEGIKGQLVAYSFTTRNYVVDAGVQGWIENRFDYPEEKGTGWYPSTKVRLFPNLPSIRFENIVHETVEKSLVHQKIKILPIDAPIHHFGDLNRTLRKKKKEIYYRLGKRKLAAQKDELKSLVEMAIEAGEVKDYQNAIEIWKTVLGRAPNFAKGFFNLGYAYIQLGKYKQAMRVSQKAIELDPGLKEAFLNLSLCQMRTGNVRKAIRGLDEFLKQHPNHPMALGNLGVAYKLIGKARSGEKCFQQIAKMGYNTREFLWQHVRDLEAAGQKKLAAALMAGT
jgi:glycosyltransferase involved in cell wall biosynthesis